MKQMNLIFALLGFALIFGCTEKDPAFNPQLVGTWEIISFSETMNTNSVTAYTFNSDGTYSWVWAFRNPGERTNFGYQLIWNGTFRTTQDQISFRVEELFDAPVGIPSSFFVPREEMVQRNYTPGNINNRRFQLSADRSTLTIFADSEQSIDEVYVRARR